MANENTRNKLSQRVNDKMNAQGNEPKPHSKSDLQNKVKEANKINKEVIPAKPAKKPKPQKEKKERKHFKFFYKLSLIGKVMFTIYVVGIAFFAFIVLNYAMHKGKPILGERQQPVTIISDDSVKQIEDKIKEDVKLDSLSVELKAYRLVVVMDLPNETTAKQAKEINGKVLTIVDGILPVKEYFSSDDKLNNDLAIYSADKISSDNEEKASYIYLTYKNSKMRKALSYDLTQPRDKESFEKVEELIKDGQ